MKPFPASIQAARELGGPIIAMTVVLVAVYVPIGFQRGLTGALFTEFAFTLVGAVTISAIVALTLSPMMCSRMLKPHAATDRGWEARLIRGIDRVFDWVRRGYSRWLKGSLNYLPVTATFAALVLGSIYFLYTATASELAPQEDQGVIIAFATSAPNSTIDQRQLYSRADLRHRRWPQGDRPRLPARRARPVDRGLRPEAVGQAHDDLQPAAADRAGRARRHRRRAGRGLPAAAAARLDRPADPVRDQHDRPVRAAERRGAEVPAGGARHRPLHLPQHRSQDRRAAGHGRDRSRQGLAARPQDERHRRRAGLDAGRRLRQLLRARRPLLQGDPAGPADVRGRTSTRSSTITSAPPTARRCRCRRWPRSSPRRSRSR